MRAAHPGRAKHSDVVGVRNVPGGGAVNHSSYQRRHKVDAIHYEALAWFKDVGFSASDTSKLGDGYPDIALGCSGVDIGVELKTDNAPLTQAQVKAHAAWRGHPRVVLRSMAAVKEWGLRTLHELRRRKAQPCAHRALTPVVVPIPEGHVLDGRRQGVTK